VAGLWRRAVSAAGGCSHRKGCRLFGNYICNAPDFVLSAQAGRWSPLNHATMEGSRSGQSRLRAQPEAAGLANDRYCLNTLASLHILGFYVRNFFFLGSSSGGLGGIKRFLHFLAKPVISDTNILVRVQRIHECDCWKSLISRTTREASGCAFSIL
jgi:hypothetical protein